MSDIADPNVSVQNAVISGAVNSSMLGILLQGIYTTVYLATAYIYMTRKLSRKFWVLSAITALYALAVVETVINWLLVTAITGMNGQPTINSYFYLLEGANWAAILNIVCDCLISVIADGLIIWRCYAVWDSSLRIIFVPLVLVLVETGFYVTSIIMILIANFEPADNVAQTINWLITGALFSTVATTLLSTLIITYRIYSVTSKNVVLRGSSRYTHILDLLVQSSALYVFGSLLLAIPLVLPLTTRNEVGVLSAQYYTGSIFPFTAGVAPTLMVARLALGKSHNVETSTRSVHVSEIQFHATSAISASSGDEQGNSPSKDRGEH